MKNIVDEMRRLSLMLLSEEQLTNLQLQKYVKNNYSDLEGREIHEDRLSEMTMDVEVSEEEIEELLDVIEEAEGDIREYLLVDSKLLTLEEVLDLKGKLQDLRDKQMHSDLAEKILYKLERLEDKEIYAYDVVMREWVAIEYSPMDYFRLKHLNLILRDDRLEYLNPDMLWTDVKHYLLIDDKDWTKFIVNKNGNVLDIRRENLEIVDFSEILKAKDMMSEAKDILEKLDIDAEKLQKTLENEVEEKAKETIELLDRAEEIIAEEKGEDDEN